MHRFGRSAQKRLNDRWGGAFILAVLLAVVGAWKLGGWLTDALDGTNKEAAMEPAPGMEDFNSNLGFDGSSVVTAPHEFQIHFVQVGAFRSEGAARSLAKQLTGAGYAAAVTPRNAQGLSKVWVGPYMDAAAAAEVKSRLAAELNDAMSVAVTVDYKPEAVMAMTGSANSDLQKGLDALNSYLYQAGNLLASLSAGMPADSASVAALGQEIGLYVSALSQVDTNPAVAQFMEMAAAAAENAAAIGAAATATPYSNEFQAAMNGYVALLDQYHSFHVQGGSN